MYVHLIGREYKIPAFSMPSRGDELLMLGKDVVALLNMRDSFVLVNKNPLVVKVDATQTDKNYLIENGYLRSTFRTRDITIVSARSIFKTFGHRVVKRGRRGKDDYFATGVPEEDSEAEEEKEEFEEKKRSASRFYTKTSEIPADSGFGAGAAALSFRRSNLTNRFVTNRGPPDEVNWIHLAALSVRDFNAQLKRYRNDNPTFYDIHTHIYQTPASKQPRFAVAPTQEALDLAAQQDAAADQALRGGDTKLAAEVTQQQPAPQAQLTPQSAQPPYALQGYSEQQQFAMNSNQLPYAM
jgi:chromatin structure-remodeling complex protein RSC7